MVFAHGYGCDQSMWRALAPAFEEDFRVVLFDHVGAGESDLAQYDPERYADLHGYAADLVEICRELALEETILRDAFAATGVAPGRICFEVTETAAIANLARATMLIERLRALGCRFALDDFGSGMSSFSYFKHLPVDYLKIDGAFIRNIVDNHIDHAMVEAINHVGHVMGLQTVAEFVESDEAVRLLRALGVDYAEGYGISRPLPIALTSTALTAEALERIAGR